MTDLTPEEARERLVEDPDFVWAKRYSYSLKIVRVRYPDGCPDRVIAALMLMTEDEVEARYQNVVEKLRKEMGVE